VGSMGSDLPISPGDTPRPYHHGDLWQALVQAGLAILHEDGMHALTLREVARRAGVSHTAPYRHFADKEALLAAIAEDGFLRISNGLRAAVAEYDGDPIGLFRLAVRLYVHFVLENPDHVRVMFSGLVKDYERYPDLCRIADQSFDDLVALTLLLQRDGLLAEDDPFLQGFAAWSMVHGLAMLLMEEHYPKHVDMHNDADIMTDACVTVLIQGMGRRN
jgi:AcrR family transcriptional regulator